jgi:hypothetical protein
MRFCYQPHTIIGIQEHPAENLPLKNRPSIVSYIADPSEIANPFGGGAAMKTSIALKIFRDYQSSNLKPSAVRGYKYLTDNFEALFGEKDLNSIYSEDTYHFSEIITENSSKSTKTHRYSQLKAFFNFVISNYQPDLKNPLDNPFMRKTFHLPKRRYQSQWGVPGAHIQGVTSASEFEDDPALPGWGERFRSHSLDGYPLWQIIQTQINTYRLSPCA